MGESPYPRRRSATGYAFEDGRASQMFENGQWFEAGIDTSLQRILKAWLVAIGRRELNCVLKQHIVDMPKEGLVQHPAEIFRRGRQRGWLWLNAAPGFFFTGDYADKERQVRYWSPLIQGVLRALADVSGVKIVLIGRLAREEHRHLVPGCIEADHPAARDGGRAFIGNCAVRDLLREWRCLIEA